MLRGAFFRTVAALLGAASLGAQADGSSQRRSTESVASRGWSNGVTGAAVEWPHVIIKDVYTRDAAKRSLSRAHEWLAKPACQSLFSEFHDERGLPLTERLRDLSATPQSYLQLVYFLDGEQSRACNVDRVLAFTEPGSRVVYLCGRYFERATRRDAREVQATIIHEVLHSLGLGENPPSPAHITDRVRRLCW
jgi:hypothetical protein